MSMKEKRAEAAVAHVADILSVIDEELTFGGRDDAGERIWRSDHYMVVPRYDLRIEGEPGHGLEGFYRNTQGAWTSAGVAKLEEVEKLTQTCVLSRLEEGMMYVKDLSADAVRINLHLKKKEPA